MSSLTDIAVGDVAWAEERWWRVMGTVTFTDDEGWSWREHLLEAGDGQRRWLTVEDDDQLLVVLWAPYTSAAIEPGHHEVIHSGVSYTLHEYGRCSYTSEGRTGCLPSGMMDYYDYAARGGLWLSFERYDGSGWEMSTGVTVAPASVQVQRG